MWCSLSDICYQFVGITFVFKLNFTANMNDQIYVREVEVYEFETKCVLNYNSIFNDKSKKLGQYFMFWRFYFNSF